MTCVCCRLKRSFVACRKEKRAATFSNGCCTSAGRACKPQVKTVSGSAVRVAVADGCCEYSGDMTCKIRVGSSRHTLHVGYLPPSRSCRCTASWSWETWAFTSCSLIRGCMFINLIANLANLVNLVIVDFEWSRFDPARCNIHRQPQPRRVDNSLTWATGGAARWQRGRCHADAQCAGIFA